MRGTQLKEARNGTITEAIQRVTKREQVDAERVREQVAAGQAVIPNNHTITTDSIR